VNRRVWIAALALASARAAALVPAGLRTEAQTDPLAIQTAQPRLSWILRAAGARDTGKAQSAYRILAASSEAALARDRGDLWDTGRVVSGRTIEIPYSGAPLHSGAQCFWKVRVWDEAGAASPWSAPARFGVGLEPGDWKGRWIAAQRDGATPAPPMPLFRRAVRLEAAPARAIAYVSGLGQYELRINGRRIGERELAPGWTNYRKTVLYNAYDVTGALGAGDNAIGVMLGDGFFNVFESPNRYTKFTGTFGQPQLMVQIRIAGADGRTTDIASDGAWKTHPGPITFSHAYGGEDYDARLEPAGWDRAGFDDAAWSPAIAVGGPGGTLAAEQNPPVEVARVYRPVSVTGPAPGVRVYDLGQNFSGWPRITVTGEAGATVKLIPGELLTAQGLVSQESSGGPQWFTYTLAGGGAAETWHPCFSYYGFRYVQVEITGRAGIAALDGQFLHAAAPVTGRFSCSKELFNRIHRLIDAAILSNMQSVLTDCPHREKLGWLEQSYLSGSGIMYNYDVQTLYEKISGDIAEAQTAGGLAPDIAPEYAVFAGGFRDSPEWGSAIALAPFLAYRHFGDERNLAAHYEEMKRYVDYLAGKAAGGILSHGLGDWYDLGPAPPGRAQLTSLEATATATYSQLLAVLARMARLLGKTADAGRFDAAAGAARDAFQARLYRADTSVYDRGSQTAAAMALALGIAPEADRGRVLSRLVDDIRAHAGHTTAGDIGFHYVIQALSEGGRSDVVYDLLANPEAPSYAAQLARGATALTEAWDAGPRSSQNHFMLGHAEEWFYRYLAGIDLDLARAPAERIVLRPTPVGDVTSAEATVDSVLGRIVSRWKISGGRLVYDVEVPPNARATVRLPGLEREIGSGAYHFEVALIRP